MAHIAILADRHMPIIHNGIYKEFAIIDKEFTKVCL